MAACVAQQLSTQLSSTTFSQQRSESTFNDSRKTSLFCRKRLLSEHNDRYASSLKFPNDTVGKNKKNKTDFFGDDAKGILHRCYETEYSILSPFERKRHSRSVSSKLFYRRCVSHSQLPYIKSNTSTHTAIPFHRALSALSKTTKTTAEENMLVCQQIPTLTVNESADNQYSSIFLTTFQLTALIKNIDQTKFIIDCGSPLRFTERRIQDSILLNVNDKISRKRLASRGIKAFLDADQSTRFDNTNLIVLYDDTTHALPCSCSSIQSQLSPAMKCIYDKIKQYDATKNICILQTSFNDFYQHSPSLCYTISLSMDQDDSTFEPRSPAPIEVDIDMYPMSEVLPGLFLGNSRDAQNLDLLEKHQIKTVVNASTSIPCHFADNFEYHRVECQDSINQDILQFFETTFKFIHEKLSNNRNVFVHCQAGISRSPSFVIGYLMKHHSKTLDEAYDLVKNRRSIIGPNLNFLGQLTRYQQMLFNV